MRDNSIKLCVLKTHKLSNNWFYYIGVLKELLGYVGLYYFNYFYIWDSHSQATPIY